MTETATHCPGCGAHIVQGRWGRPKVYCSDACKQKVYRERKRRFAVMTESRKAAQSFFGRQGVTKVQRSTPKDTQANDSIMTPAVRRAIEAAEKALRGVNYD